MNEFTGRRREQESHQLPDGAKGEREVEEDQGPEAEEPPLKQELAHVRWGGLVGLGRALVLCLGAPWGHGCQLSAGHLNLQSFFFH